MQTGVCPVCGEHNEPGTAFCVVCRTYLGWERTGLEPPREAATTPQPPGDQPGNQTPGDQQTMQTRLIPRIPADEGAAGGDHDPGDLTADDRFRLAVENPAVTLAPTGEPAEIEVRISNISRRVDGYVAEALSGSPGGPGPGGPGPGGTGPGGTGTGEPGPGAAGPARPVTGGTAPYGTAPGTPDWLVVSSSPVELFPGTDEMLRIQFRVNSPRLVPAQQLPVTVRVKAMNEPLAYVDLTVAVTVAVVEAPLRLHAEPRLLRVQDRPDAVFTLTLDNSSSNRVVRAELTGSDPELAVQFRFDPPVVEIGPATTATARVSVRAEPPPSGQDLSRSLTVTAREGNRVAETPVTFLQSTSVQVEDPPVELQLEPELIRVRDNPVGLTRLTVDNRRGQDWAHVQLAGSDREQVVYVSFDSPQLHVPPGQTAQTHVRLHGPLPELGSETNRSVTITATDAKQRTSTAVATFVQTASESPMTTLGVRLEPEVSRVRDSDHATVQVVLDNRKGHFRVRLNLAGSDPERAVGFAFEPPVVDVEAGSVRTVELRLAAWRPQPGEERSRQITVRASDGNAAVEASGSLVQATSRSPMETLGLTLDPSVLRLNGRRGVLSALVDNRKGTQPIRVTLTGDDPENAVRFAISPAVVDVPAGGIVRSTVNVRAPRPASGREATRSIMLKASDGRSEVTDEGSLVQKAGDWRPLARILFTLIGAALMILGATRDLATRREGIDLSATQIAELFGFQLIDPFAGFADFVSVGAAVIVLAIVMAFGLTGPSGRLTRLAAFVAAALVAGVYITLMFVPDVSAAPSGGAIVVILGCVLGYIGGLLVKR